MYKKLVSQKELESQRWEQEAKTRAASEATLTQQYAQMVLNAEAASRRAGELEAYTATLEGAISEKQKYAAATGNELGQAHARITQADRSLAVRGGRIADLELMFTQAERGVESHPRRV